MNGEDHLSGPALDPLMEMGYEGVRAAVSRIEGWKRSGITDRNVLERIGPRTPDDPASRVLLDIAKTRKRSGGKYSDGKRLFFTAEGLRWGTPEVAAEHCASRLSGPSAADVTCGQGGQVLSLARHCDRVLAVEIDPLNAFIASLNIEELSLDNVSLVRGDCMDPGIAGKVEPGSYVFSDPARPQGALERSLDDIVPDPRRILSVYSDISPGFCFEVPPYMSLDQVEFPCEAEYLSLDRRLNRLNLYTGDLMKGAVSAVVLPGGYSITGVSRQLPLMEEKIVSGEYAYEADPALVRSGLLRDALEETGMDIKALCLDGRRCLLFSREPIEAGFLGMAYKVVSICSEDALSRELKDAGAGKVTLRYNVDPSEYWERRLELESGLNGDKKVHLFKGEQCLILEPFGGRITR
ncbi:MAG: hypothetical protein QCI82_04100 [Candidatus Thermoplasmatota archaeon]|nr:hypothetical protein [Candidatus Thermoplasmatota archaeon]